MKDSVIVSVRSLSVEKEHFPGKFALWFILLCEKVFYSIFCVIWLSFRTLAVNICFRFFLLWLVCAWVYGFMCNYMLKTVTEILLVVSCFIRNFWKSGTWHLTKCASVAGNKGLLHITLALKRKEYQFKAEILCGCVACCEKVLSFLCVNM